MSDFQAFQDLLSSPKRIAITTHQKPDGDAIGSSLALYHYLIKKGHRVDLVVPTEFAEFLKWVPGADKIIVGPEDDERANWIFEGADAIFCLDLNSLQRIAPFDKVVRDASGTKVMIDHHMEPEGFHSVELWDETASSTAELIYRLITGLGDGDLIDQDIAEAIYTGTLTDTGSFRFTNTSPAVHRMVADLIEKGVSVNKIYEHIYNNGSVDRLRFIGHCLSERLNVLPEFRAAYFKIPREVFRNFNIRTGDTEGLVNYALSIKGVDLAVLLTEQDDLSKLSFRSRGEVSSVAFAEEFNGGGHFYAAGGRIKQPIDTTEVQLRELIEARLKPENSQAEG